jgi:Gas vesicle synthesis protein GvpL/GvpF
VLYVYGVVRAGHPPPDRPGVGTPPGEVRLVESGPLAAAVTELPDDFAAGEEDAHAHLSVLIGLLKHGTVIPLRMGTAAPDESAVRRDVLDAVRDDMVGRLDQLDGLVELHVDADDDETESIAAVARAAGLRPAAATDLESRMELGQEIAALLFERRQQLAAEILADLRPVALADVARTVSQGPEDPVLRWAFLVKRDDVEIFDESVIAVRSLHPSMSIRYVGPLPPVHFVDWQRTEASREPDSFTGDGRWSW